MSFAKRKAAIACVEKLKMFTKKPKIGETEVMIEENPKDINSVMGKGNLAAEMQYKEIFTQHNIRKRRFVVDKSELLKELLKKQHIEALRSAVPKRTL